jgi:membrane fusion protein, macrolide-specific efflux system
VKNPLRRRGLLVNGGLAVLLAAGAGYAYLSLRDDPAGASSPGRIVRVSRGTLVSSVSASGSVSSVDSRDLAFGATGTVETIKVGVGDHVKKGQLLATLDDASAQDAVRSAQAARDAAADADTGTLASHSASVQAQVAYDNAQRALDGTRLTAPFAGTIVAVNGTVGGSSGGSSGGSQTGGTSTSAPTTGTSSTATTGFMTIADMGRLQISGKFTEADVAKVKKGQSATVTFDAVPGAQASGKVTAIDQSATVTNNVVQYGVTVRLTDPPSGLRIGATGTVQVTTSRADDVLYAPSAAVRTVGGRSTVTVMQNGKPVVRAVQTGAQGDQGTEITSGLNEGDQLLIASTGATGFPSGRFPGGLGGGGGPIRVGGRG